MVLVLDIARYHYAVLLKPLLRKYRSARTLLFLPLYSPRLASVERSWKLARPHGDAQPVLRRLGRRASTTGEHPTRHCGDYAA
jgi:transposase